MCCAISQTDDELWLGIWFVPLIFLGVPFGLAVFRDLVLWITPRWLERGPLLLHTCAGFAALIGYGLGGMALDYGHPKAHIHRLFVVIFPLIVYAIPLLLYFSGLPISSLKDLYVGREDKNE